MKISRTRSAHSQCALAAYLHFFVLRANSVPIHILISCRGPRDQILQIVGSIQNTNDLDVHMALILAPSYANQVRNQYYMENTLSQSLRDYVDTFGFCQKNMNAMDIIIEDTKQLLASWGGEEPDFMLVAPKLCFQLTMTQVWWVVGVFFRSVCLPH